MQFCVIEIEHFYRVLIVSVTMSQLKQRKKVAESDDDLGRHRRFLR